MTRLGLLRLTRGRKVRLAGVASVLVLGAVWSARYGVDGVSPDEAIRTGLRFGLFLLLVPLAPFLFASDAIGEEVEGRTFPLIAARASGRPALALGKLLAAAVCSACLLIATEVVMEIGCYASELGAFGEAIPDLGRHVLGLGLTAIAYTSICALLGALAPEASGILGAAYLVVVDLGFGMMPGFFRLVSFAHHGRVLAGLAPGGILESSVPVIPAWASASVLTVGAVGATLATMFVVSVVEYRFRDSG